MADERDLSNKIADGLWGVTKSIGSKIGDAASNLGSQASDLAALPAEDMLGSLWQGKNTAEPLQQNFQDNTKVFNAQSPTPFGENTTVLPNDMGGVSDINNMVLNSNAYAQNAPLNQAQAAVLTDPKGIGAVPVLPEVQGIAAAVAAPMSQAATPIDQTAQISTQGIVDPFAGSNAKAMQGINQAEQAGQLKAVAEHAYYQKKADAEAEAMQKQEALQEAFNFQYQEKMDGLTQSMKDFKALAGEKIIPGAILARQDTTGSLMTGLAVALGGIGGALQGTNANIGLEMINKAIDRDIAAQQYNLEHKTRIGKANIDDQSSLLSKMREKFGDDKSAILASKLSMLSMVEDKMNQDLTKQGGSRDLAVKSQANMARSQIMKQKETIELQLKAAQAQQYEQQQMIGNLKGSRKKWGDMELMAYEKITGDKTVRDRMVPGWGTATNKSLAEEFTKANIELEGALDGINRIKQLTGGFNKVTDLATRRRIEAERQALVGNLRLPFTGPGILNESERAMLERIIGDPTKILSLNSLEAAALHQVMTKIKSDQKKRAKLAGLEEPENLDTLGQKVP